MPADPTPGTPRTEAGRRLLASDIATTGWSGKVVMDFLAEHVLAIEAEAATGLDVERLALAMFYGAPGWFKEWPENDTVGVPYGTNVRWWAKKIAERYARLAEPPDA